uniref:G-protein-signaling modulator 2 n=2 Tax=Parascaris univalens TaxID=6257 RepID=A0A915CG10_PARUN
MSVPLAVEGMDALALAQEGERLCRENNMKAGIKYLEMALEKKVNLGGRSIETVSAIYSQLGNAYFALRDFNKALEYHQYDLETAKLLNDQSGLAKANGNVANTYKALGDFDSAYDHAVVHLKIAREMNDKESEARALYNMGSIYHCRAKTRIRSAAHRDISALSLSVPSDRSTTSELQAAINCYLQNLQIVEETEDLAACGRTYGNIGNTYYMLGDYVTAVEYHNKRLEVARQFGDRAAMKRAYTNLGNAHIFLSLPAKAIEYYRLALSMATELGDEVSEAQCCFSLGSGAAISGDFRTAAEFHTRHLMLARKLGDRCGEARACTALAEDCAAVGETRKALYFYVLHAQIAAEMGDHLGESSARISIDELLRGLNEGKSPTANARRISDVLDSSADPSPRPLTHLSISMQSLLLGEHNDCGLSRRAISTSTSSISEAQKPLVNLEDDFIDMLSRMQSKRINDQRCDPIILSDLTNRSKGIARQSDTFVRGAQSVGHVRKANRLSAIIGRVGKAARHTFLLPSSSFLPASTSTPRLSITKSADDQRPSSAFSRPLFDRSVSTVSETGTEDEVRSRMESEIPAETQLDGEEPSSPYSVTSESPLFRVPKVPPRNRARAAHGKSQSALTDLGCGALVDKRNGAEDMLDLIESLQGRRMEEQRAHLSVNVESVSVSGINPEEPKESSGAHKTERSRSEDAHSLYEMLIRSQSDRLEEQRSELPSTVPDEDISQIVLTMQKGRIEAQRAHLKPPDED